MTIVSELGVAPHRVAVLDQAHIGAIRGALGTIRQGDVAPRIGWGARWKTLLAILGPGLIVMTGDNDAGAFSTYRQAGQNYGTALLWTLVPLLLVLGSLLVAPPVLMIHPSAGELANGLLVPQMPEKGELSDVMLLVIGIIGTTVAPWQLFFQQGYTIDKRITPRFIRYARSD